MRHCICGRVTSEVYDASQCRLCWLYRYDERYRTRWGTQRAACPFEGEETGTRDCPSCNGRVRLKLFRCNHPARQPEEVSRQDCNECPYRPKSVENVMKRIILKNHLSPGDVTTMSAAIYSLHKYHPGKFLTAVDTTCNAVFEHNPDVIQADPSFEILPMNYPLIDQCNQRAVHMIQGYCDYLEQILNVRVPLMTNRPMLYLSNEEKNWQNQVSEQFGIKRHFWLVNAGVKTDFTAKTYPWYQEVVDRLQGKILFVQIGKPEHVHKPLKGVLNLLGRTDDRQLIRLVHHAAGVLCGTTFLMHIAAGFQKPAVILAGGREPRSWNTYGSQTLLSSIGTLPCCRTDSCWKSRVVKLNDGAEQDNSICDHPVFTDPPSPQCLAVITPDEVANAILKYQ